MSRIFERDESKRRSNIEKHGLDVLDVGEVFAGPHLVAGARTVSDEQRHAAIGLIDGIAVAVIYTQRDDVVRVISIRRARRGERHHSETVFG